MACEDNAESLRRAAAGEDRHRFPRNIPLSERKRNRQVGGTAKIENTDFLADQVRGLADVFLRYHAKRKSIERRGNNRDVTTPQTDGNRRARRPLSEIGTSGDQGRQTRQCRRQETGR